MGAAGLVLVIEPRPFSLITNASEALTQIVADGYQTSLPQSLHRIPPFMYPTRYRRQNDSLPLRNEVGRLFRHGNISLHGLDQIGTVT